jgi:hypothetical protein
LNDDGVFFQWIPLYDMDALLFRTILSNLRGVFPHLRLYRISAMEMGLLAAKMPLQHPAIQRRFDEPEIQQTRRGLKFDSLDLLSLIRLFETRELDLLVDQGETLTHTLASPGLAYASDRIRFVNPPIDWNSFLDVRLTRVVRATDERQAAFARMLETFPGGLRCNLPTAGTRLFCERYNRLLGAYSIYSLPPGQTSPASQVQSYDILRQDGVLAPDAVFLDRVTTRLVEGFAGDPQGTQSALDTVFTIFVKDGLVDQAQRTLSALAERGLIGPDYQQGMMSQLRAGQQARDQFINGLSGG